MEYDGLSLWQFHCIFIILIQSLELPPKKLWFPQWMELLIKLLHWWMSQMPFKGSYVIFLISSLCHHIFLTTILPVWLTPCGPCVWGPSIQPIFCLYPLWYICQSLHVRMHPVTPHSCFFLLLFVSFSVRYRFGYDHWWCFLLHCYVCSLLPSVYTYLSLHCAILLSGLEH